MINVQQVIPDVNQVFLKEATVNLAVAAGAYDVVTATGGGVVIVRATVYVSTAGTAFTSVRIHTDQTNDTNILSGAEGALANIVAQKVLDSARTNTSIYLASGQKVKYTMIGATGTGELKVVFEYKPLVEGARLV